MTAPKTKYPISSFGPELMAFLTKSGREKVVVKFEGPRGLAAANNFRRRIHTLRSRMREENHEDYKFAARAKITIQIGEAAVKEGGPEEWKGDDQGVRGAVVVGQPHDVEFASVLAEAGVTLDHLPPETANRDPEPVHKSAFGGFLDELEPLITPPEGKK